MRAILDEAILLKKKQKKVSQLIIEPAYISDCSSSVVSTSRQLIKAFPFSLLYTWTLVASSQEKLSLCCTAVEALLHAAITSIRRIGSIFISSHVTIWQSSVSLSKLGNTKRFSCEDKLLMGIKNRHILQCTLLQPREKIERKKVS